MGKKYVLVVLKGSTITIKSIWTPIRSRQGTEMGWVSEINWCIVIVREYLNKLTENAYHSGSQQIWAT